MEVFYPGNGQKAFAIKEYGGTVVTVFVINPKNTFSSDSTWSGNGSGIIIKQNLDILLLITML